MLNPRALTQTPNMIAKVQGQEARRSDMFWAIANRNYRRMVVKAVGFPILHVARRNAAPSFSIDKVQAEVIGSTLFAGVTEFLESRPQHELDFSNHELDKICGLADAHLSCRWKMLEQSFHRIIGLMNSIKCSEFSGELHELLQYLDEWFNDKTITRLRADTSTHTCQATRDFLSSLRPMTDNFASGAVCIDFIHAQLGDGPCIPRGARA